MKKTKLFLAVMFVTFLPLQVLAAPSGMVWVYIDDPGVSGHEGFSGQMSKYETTNAQYCQYLNAAKASNAITVSGNYVVGTSGPYSGQNYYNLAGSGVTYDGATNGGAARINWTGSSFTVDGGFDNHPVTYVSWYGSTAFANYYGWRLPTEWEWQAVADYNGSYNYGCGTTINNSIANYRESTHPYGTTAVGVFGTYGYGMCDMAGNVWEWTDSCYYAGCSPDYRVLRGGGWHFFVSYCSVSSRSYNYPFDTHFLMGFRVCRNLSSTTLAATNNWDGKTINLSWSSGAGSVKIYRKKESGSYQYVTTVSGSPYTDTIDEPGKNYTYVLKNSGDTTISNEAVVKAEVIVVLVRGYSLTTPVDPNYWESSISDVNKGLVPDVTKWFQENNGVTCWVPPQGYLPEEGLSGWKSIAQNSDELEDFIDEMRTGPYSNAKINLIGHSMGGLICRKYAYDHSNIVNNIFCIQTPHTGSPLAAKGMIWDGIKYAFVNIVSMGKIKIYNNATYNLTTTSMNSFNDDYPITNKTKLYSVYSNNWRRVLEDALLTAGNIAMEQSVQFTHNKEHSDGVVPYLSAQGKIYEQEKTGFLQYEWKIVPKIESMAGTMDNEFDHFTGYRHPDTLEQIMNWLGLPYAQSSAHSMGMVLAQAENGEPNVVPQYYVAGFNGDISSLVDVNETVSIGNSQTSRFMAVTSDVNCTFWLTDPCGTIYDQTYASSELNVNYVFKDEFFAYEVNSPVPGEWTLNLSTNMALPETVSYGLTVFESENITLYSYSNPSWANTDANILIVATLTENDNPLTDANIVAGITLPDVNSWSLTLYDDGLHNDANADDGIYTNTFATTSQSGTYNVQVRATGLSDLGTNFERNGSLSFTVSSPDVYFTENINDVGIDLNANVLYDILRFTIPVDVCEPNDYLLTATLSDSNDALIKLLSSGSLALPVGPNTILLEITAEDIVTHDVNGPYILSDITISNANTGLTIAEANDYNTVAYAVAAFEPLDTDNDGLSDNLELLIGTDIYQTDSDFDGVSDYDEVGYDGDANSYNVATDLNPLNADTDSDGMGDGWEINFGYDPLVDDGAKNNDDDSDGLINLEEFQNSTLPNNSDTDSDGISDGNEINIYTTNPTNIDTDADGLIDGDEVDLYGTIPTNPDTDDDNVMDGIDNCKLTSNSDQNDLDGDGIGDLCDSCPNDSLNDIDSDGLCGDVDNCPSVSNSDQGDMDADGKGDECDCLADLSNNDFINFEDFALFASHWSDTDCTAPSYCGATDFDKSGTVDLNDLAEIAQQWLENITP